MKHLPVSIVLTIILQTVAVIWYIGTLDSSIAANARQIERHEIEIQSLQEVVHSQAIMLARMDDNIKAIRMAVEK